MTQTSGLTKGKGTIYLLYKYRKKDSWILHLSFEHVYNAPIEKVWRTLADKEKMEEWYFRQLKRFKPVVGYEFEFMDDGSPYKKEWRVTQVVDGKLLAHS